MGVFSKLKQRKAERATAEEMRNFAQEKRREEERLRNEAYKAVKHAKVAAHMAQPGYDLDGLPFGNREYVCTGSAAVEKATGEVLQDDSHYYADHEALRLLARDIEMLESLIDGPVLGIPSLPPLCTEFGLIVPVESPDDIAENNARLMVHPLTKTGKKAKYPVSVHFSAYEQGMTAQNGSHGSLYYLQNHSVGKADIHYWKDHVYYGVRWKIVDGELAIGGIDYSDAGEFDRIRLYSA